MSPISQRFPIPTDPHVFEEMCRDLLRLHWSRPNLQLYGKRGEDQSGVDILDLGGTEPLAAAQCKLKEEHKALTPQEIFDEVEKAKGFALPIGKYAILTTGKVSTQAQLKVREINQAHIRDALFEVELFTWETICELLQRYTDVQEHYFSEIATGRATQIVTAIGEVREDVATLTTRVEGNDIDRQINEARESISRHEHQLATLLLNRIEQNNSGALTPEQRFRLLSNHGVAVLGRGKPEEAAKYFLQALPYLPNDERALTNEVFAYYLVGDVSTAHSKAATLRGLYPASTRLAAYWILTARSDIPIRDLESAISSIVLADAEVKNALARKALRDLDFIAAEGYAKEASRHMPEWSQPQLTLAQVYLGRVVGAEKGVATGNESRTTLIDRALAFATEAARLAEEEEDTQIQIEALVVRVDLLLLVGRKEEASEDAILASSLDPDNIHALLAVSQTLGANGRIEEGVAALRKAYTINPRADVALAYARAIAKPEGDSDLRAASDILLKIQIEELAVPMRSTIAIETIRCLQKRKEWKAASDYLDKVDEQLRPETSSTLRAWLAHSQGAAKEAGDHAAKAASLLTVESPLEDKDFLARIFVLMGRMEDALPLFQELFDADLFSFDPGNLLDCAARLHRDDVVIRTCERLHERGVNDWNLVSFEVQYVQKYDARKAAERLDVFLKKNPDHRQAKLCRSIVGVLANRPELVSAGPNDLPAVNDLTKEFILPAVQALRFANEPYRAIEYAYQYLRLHFDEFEAHRAYLASMAPWDPLPSIPVTVDVVAVGTAVCYQEPQKVELRWLVIEETTRPVHEFDEIASESELARELIGKRVNETFLVHSGSMNERRGVIRQILSKYVRRYQDCGEMMEVRFGQASIIEAVPLGSTEEEMRESIERVLESLRRQATNITEIRRVYNQSPLPFHWYGNQFGRSTYLAVIDLARQDGQQVRSCFGSPEERTAALSSLQTAQAVVVDVSVLATLRLLGLEKVLATNRFRFLLTENTWRELRETLLLLGGSSKASIAIGFEDGVQTAHEETAAFKQQKLEADRGFLELVEKHVGIVPVPELAELEPKKREAYETFFGQYGAETIVLAAKPDYVLWTDDLVQAQLAQNDLGSGRRVWTQVMLGQLADAGLIMPDERDVASARLVGMGFTATTFDSSAMLQAVTLSDAKSWQFPLKQFVEIFANPTADARSLLTIFAEFVAKLYRTPMVPENMCGIVTAILDAFWKNPNARRGLLIIRNQSSRLFGLNALGESRFKDCFDQWMKRIENPIVLAT